MKMKIKIRKKYLRQVRRYRDYSTLLVQSAILTYLHLEWYI